eukprot:2898721-Amphidinium_carterae.1
MSHNEEPRTIPLALCSACLRTFSEQGLSPVSNDQVTQNQFLGMLMQETERFSNKSSASQTSEVTKKRTKKKQIMILFFARGSRKGGKGVGVKGESGQAHQRRPQGPPGPGRRARPSPGHALENRDRSATLPQD